MKSILALALLAAISIYFGENIFFLQKAILRLLFGFFNLILLLLFVNDPQSFWNRHTVLACLCLFKNFGQTIFKNKNLRQLLNFMTRGPIEYSVSPDKYPSPVYRCHTPEQNMAQPLMKRP